MEIGGAPDSGYLGVVSQEFRYKEEYCGTVLNWFLGYWVLDGFFLHYVVIGNRGSRASWNGMKTVTGVFLVFFFVPYLFMMSFLLDKLHG